MIWEELKMTSDLQKDISDFFLYRDDQKMQKMMLSGYSCEIKTEALQYIDKIVKIPLDLFVEYIKGIKRQPIYASDVFQFSDFDDATINLCARIKCDNKGLHYLETGKILFNDNVSRTDSAYRKYGENHIKMAASLGLAFKVDDIYYLSPIGCTFDELPKDVRNKLLVRLILRNKLISQLLLEASKKSFDMEAYLYELSESTYKRRRTNIKYVMGLLNSSTEYDFSTIIRNINY